MTPSPLIYDIAAALHRTIMRLRNGIHYSNEQSFRLTEDVIFRCVRVEVNEYDWFEAHYQHSPGNPDVPTEIIGVRVYTISERYGKIPEPGWRIINPFETPKKG